MNTIWGLVSAEGSSANTFTVVIRVINERPRICLQAIFLNAYTLICVGVDHMQAIRIKYDIQHALFLDYEFHYSTCEFIFLIEKKLL